MIEAGRVLGKRYRLTEHIAAGGMGDVWRADDDVLERPVAVKVLRPEHAVDSDFVARFRAEARHAAGLSHPRITAVYDYGEATDGDTTLAYLVMELVPGEPLSALLARSGPLSVDRTLAVVAETADALQVAHDAGVVHRDVKPGNILVRPDGGVSITDFGIARATNEPGHLTRTGLVLGTAYYLPPEQAAGKPVTPASDLYALGVVAYECLTGDRPFAGDNAVQVAVAHLRDAPPPLPDEIPVPVRDLVMRLLAKDPDERPARASDVAAAARALRVAPDVPPPADSTTRVLAPVAATISGPADVTEQAPKRPRWKADAYPGQRRARTLLLLVGLVVIVVGAVGLVLVNGNHAGSSANTSPPTPAPSRTSTTAPSITLDSNRYVGRPFSDVQHDLITLGFSVQRRNQESDAEPDTVIAINPSGPVQPNSTVTVIVATGGNHGGHHGDGKGNGNND